MGREACRAVASRLHEAGLSIAASMRPWPPDGPTSRPSPRARWQGKTPLEPSACEPLPRHGHGLARGSPRFVSGISHINWCIASPSAARRKGEVTGGAAISPALAMLLGGSRMTQSPLLATRRKPPLALRAVVQVSERRQGAGSRFRKRERASRPGDLDPLAVPGRPPTPSRSWHKRCVSAVIQPDRCPTRAPRRACAR